MGEWQNRRSAKSVITVGSSPTVDSNLKGAKMKKKARKVRNRKPKKETRQEVYTEQNGWWKWEKIPFDGVGVA